VLLAKRHEDLMAGYVGETAAIERMRDHFRSWRFLYQPVVSTST